MAWKCGNDGSHRNELFFQFIKRSFVYAQIISLNGDGSTITMRRSLSAKSDIGEFIQLRYNPNITTNGQPLIDRTCSNVTIKG